MDIFRSFRKSIYNLGKWLYKYQRDSILTPDELFDYDLQNNPIDGKFYYILF